MLINQIIVREHQIDVKYFIVDEDIKLGYKTKTG